MSKQATMLTIADKYLGGCLGGILKIPQDLNFVVDYGKGSKFYDLNGEEYLDYYLGSGPLILGHANPRVSEVVTKRLLKGTTFYTLNAEIIDLSEKLCQIIGCAERIKFATTGSEATYFALRLARAYTGKNKIIKFEGGFHGNHDYSVISIWPEEPLKDLPEGSMDSAGIPGFIKDTVLIAPFNDIKAVCSIIEDNKGEIAAVIVEPYQRVIPPKEGFLKELRDITRKHNIVFIMDEVVTGFRFMYGGAQDYYGVIPDLAAIGKIIGGGFSLSAVCGSEEILSLADPEIKNQSNFTYFSGTMSGNPLSAAASLATLEVLQEEGVYSDLHEKGKQMRTGLQSIMDNMAIAAQITGEGPCFNIIFSDQQVSNYRDFLRSDRKMLSSLSLELLKRKVFSSVLNYISTEHTVEDIDKTLTIYEDALKAIK